MMMRILCLISVLAAAGLNPAAVAGQTASGGATIRGVIFISPSGKLEGDLVMRGVDVEVVLLRGEGSFEAELAALRRNRTPTIEKQLEVVNRAQEEFLRSTTGPREEMEKRSVGLRQERAKLAELRETYANEVTELIAQHTAAKTTTDAEGKFTVEGIPPGHYFVHAHFEIVGMGIHYYWLLPVELEKKREVDISLTKLNARPLF